MRNGTANYVITNERESLRFDCCKDVSFYLGVDPSTIVKCAQGGWKCKGYSVERVQSEWERLKDKRLMKIWSGMHERCERKRHMAYCQYGGRGISVCDEWTSYLTFAKWAIANGYAADLTLDRLDNDKGYSPDNCRWATAKEQANNKRNNHLVTLNGVSHTIAEWSELLGIKKTTIKERLKCGWTDEQALTTPVRKRKGADMKGENNG